MSKMPFVPPFLNISKPDKETAESLSIKKPKDFEKSVAYEKYVKPTLDREKKLKREARRKWWRNNWIGVTTLIFTALTLIATIGFGLFQALSQFP